MSRISATVWLFNLMLLGLFAVSVLGMADGAAGPGAFTQLTGLLSLGMSMGQWLCVPMIIGGALLWWWSGRRNR